MIRISAELARAYCVLRQRPDQWFTSKELARWACTAPSTSRSITRKLAEQGLLEVRRLSPAFLFRANFASGDVGSLQALDEACEVYGLPSDLNPAADRVFPGGSGPGRLPSRAAGTFEPVRLTTSVRDSVLSKSQTKGCWFAYGLSMMDGYHSELLLVDRTGAEAKIYWLD